MVSNFYRLEFNRLAFCWCLLPFCFLTPVVAQDAELEFEQQVAKVTERASQSVVGLETIGGSGRVDGIKKSRGPGTGIAIGEAGWVLTAAYHLADNPSSIVASLPNGKRVPAEVVATDRSRNIVLLKLATEEKLAVLPTVRRDRLNVGQSLIALGKGFDVNSIQVSTGILSETDRVWGRAIQTDAKISPANYGGPLLNLKGQVTGILVPLSPRGNKVMTGSEWYDSGIGFAIPIDEILPRLPELKKGNDQFLGKLGVSFQGTDIYVDDCEVAFCTGNSPAGKAGLRPGDRIVSVNDIATPRQAAFRHAIGPLYAGDEIKLKVDRNGTTENLTAVLTAKLPAYTPVEIGIAVDKTQDNARQKTKSSDPVDLIVRQVNPGSAADEAGIKVGDKIVEANGVELIKRMDLVAQIASTSINEKIELTVIRNSTDPNSTTQKIEATVKLRNASVPETSAKTESVESTSFELKIAEASNSCFVVGPKKTDSHSPLIVWLQPPGKLDPDKIKSRWKDACEAHRATVLVIGAANDKEWTAEESAVVLRAIGTLGKSRNIDRSRVVVGGEGAGGTMASLVCFGQPRVFQGLVLESASASKQLPAIATNPVAPIMVLVSGGAERAESNLQPIIESKTPIERVQSVSSEEIVRWACFVDRL
jgi:serine protease Do